MRIFKSILCGFFNALIVFFCASLMISCAFAENENIEKCRNHNPTSCHLNEIIDELTQSATDPYTASLPLIASAELGESERFQVSLNKILEYLEILDKTPTTYPTWMQSQSFKAWMWGRILLASNNIQDVSTTNIAKNHLSQLLVNEKITENENFAFFAWAWAYRAALNQEEYYISKESMMQHAEELSIQYQNNPQNHSKLSDALWAWVMNLYAAAKNQDQETYDLIKQQILHLQNTSSIEQALSTGLLRTSESNDYPAWALAKVKLAAALIKDKNLYQAITESVDTSIEASKKATAKAEYLLAVAENQLATVGSPEK